MNKLFKKIAVVLAMAMVFAAMPMSVFAADDEAKIGDTTYPTLSEAFSQANNGDEVVILKAGTYSLSTSGKNITITGAVDGVVFDNIGAKNMGGANVEFNNVTFDYYPNVNYTGLQHSGDLVYNNCTFNGQVFLYGTSETFNSCTFNQNSSDAYNVWTYGAKEIVFDKCTFNSAGKSVLIYSEQSDLVNYVTVTKTKFNATTAVEGKAAIEMDSSLTSGIYLTIDSETTATGFGKGSLSGNSLWNNKKANVTEGTDVFVTIEQPKEEPTAEPEATTHEHVWGYNAQFDAAAHWDYCHVCGAQNTPAAHSDADGNGVCDCGWVLTSTPSRVNPNTGVTAEMLK